MTKAQSIDAIPDFTARYKPRARWLKRDEYAKLLDALERVERPGLSGPKQTGGSDPCRSRPEPNDDRVLQ